VRHGAFSLKKAAAQAWTLGAKLYWNNTAKECTTSASGNTLIGLIGAAAADADVTGVAILDGAAATT
jgi:predicted RecA/RadA family phage recombinase